MIKGLYTAFTAMESAWRYQEVLANNVANANTAGFKREVAAFESFADVLLTQQTPTVAPLPSRIQAVVGQIGTGKFISDFQTDFAQGAFQATGNELDLALGGGFFAVQDPSGQVFYTRDGGFSRDAAGQLVTSHGNFVLAVDGAPITIPESGVSIDPDGVISGQGGEWGQVGVFDFAPTALRRAGEGYFLASSQGTPLAGQVRQGFIERSNSNLVDEMTSLLAVQRAYQANQTIVRTLDTTLDQAASQLGQYGR